MNAIIRSLSILFVVTTAIDHLLPCNLIGTHSFMIHDLRFSFFRADLQALFEWFDANPNDDCCHFGSILCGVCCHVSLRLFSHTEKEALNSRLDPDEGTVHEHRTDKVFMCMVYSLRFISYLVTKYDYTKNIEWNTTLPVISKAL